MCQTNNWEALGCLALSKLIDMPAPSTTEDDSGDWDGDEGRQTAFCNSVNVRMEKAGDTSRGQPTALFGLYWFVMFSIVQVEITYRVSDLPSSSFPF